LGYMVVGISLSAPSPKTDKAAKIWQAEKDLENLKQSLAMFSARAQESTNQANTVKEKIQAVEKALAELRKPDPIKHGDYGLTQNGGPRTFMLCEGKIAAYNSKGEMIVSNANQFDKEYGDNGNYYKILGNVFEDMAKKA
jgi:hypothetical protein